MLAHATNDKLSALADCEENADKRQSRVVAVLRRAITINGTRDHDRSD
jgi:hypothetical protein